MNHELRVVADSNIFFAYCPCGEFMAVFSENDGEPRDKQWKEALLKWRTDFADHKKKRSNKP